MGSTTGQGGPIEQPQPVVKLDVEITIGPYGALTGRVRDPQGVLRTLRPPGEIDPPTGCEEPTAPPDTEAQTILALDVDGHGIQGPCDKCGRSPSLASPNGDHRFCLGCLRGQLIRFQGAEARPRAKPPTLPRLDLPAGHDRCGSCRGHGYVAVITSWRCTICKTMVSQDGAYTRITAHRVRHVTGSPVCQR